MTVTAGLVAVRVMPVLAATASLGAGVDLGHVAGGGGSSPHRCSGGMFAVSLLSSSRSSFINAAPPHVDPPAMAIRADDTTVVGVAALFGR